MGVTADRLREAMEGRALDQATLAAMVGVTQGAISLILLGKTQKSRFLPDIAQALQVPLSWLMGETELPGRIGNAPRLPDRVIEQPDANYVMVDLLPTYAGAGGGGSGEGDLEQVAFARALIEREFRAQASDMMAVQVLGDSMEPDFRNGDQLLIDKRATSITQPGAFCLWDGDGYVIKLLEKVYDTDPPKVRVISRNQVYRAAERLAEEVRIMGRVVWFGRRV
jgi:phage repressor protein C with HTH and peptisase S24 domain